MRKAMQRESPQQRRRHMWPQEQACPVQIPNHDEPCWSPMGARRRLYRPREGQGVVRQTETRTEWRCRPDPMATNCDILTMVLRNEVTTDNLSKIEAKEKVEGEERVSSMATTR
jgi:hypothetical protein